MNIVFAGATDPGKKRANNEDAYITLDAVGLCAVADGVGGSEGGEVASRVAIETLAAAVSDELSGKDRTLPNGLSAEGDTEIAVLRRAVERANRTIREERLRHPELADMGTTLTALLFRKGRAVLVHVGDSRAYLLRSGELRQLSVDHTLVSEYVRAGLLTPAEARISPHRHVITRALGSKDEAASDMLAQTIRQGDIFLLCTDGLTDMVPDPEIADILAANPPGKAVQGLIAAANRGGGVDNITAVVAQVKEI